MEYRSSNPANPASIDLLVPKAFPVSPGRADRYAMVDLDAIANDKELSNRIRAIAAAGQLPIDAALMDRLPALEIIAKFGVGYDTVDVDAAAARNIVVTNTPDVLTDEVADLTLGLLIATVRRIPQAERFLRAGKWRKEAFPLSGSLRGRKVGIAGLGRIGRAVAERIAAMGLEVAYTSRTPKADAPWTYHSDITALARACDVLIAVVPGGTQTDGLIESEVLAALGSDGVFINVARGSVVDEPALIDALETGLIGAAGLDVFADEPNVPARLLELQNVVLLPHVGSGTVTTRQAMGDLVFANLDKWFAGEGPITPVT